MKRKIFTAAVFLMVIIAAASLSSYADTETDISCSDVMRKGEVFELTYKISDSYCLGFQGDFEYDDKYLSIRSITPAREGWTAEFTGNGYFLLYSNDFDVDKSSYTGDLLKISFDIADDTPENHKFTFAFRNVVGSDMSKEQKLSDVTLTKLLDAPLSSVCTLSRLAVSRSSLTPSFSPDVHDYSILLGVEYDVGSLELDYDTEDSLSTVEIIGNNLQVGMNTVRIIITAENGDIGEYTVTVKRNHSPDEGTSGDSRVSEIILSQGQLSPSFSPDTYDYVVYLPYESTELNISATPVSAFAREVSVTAGALSKGENHFSVTCMAENTSKSIYSITVYVMPDYYGKLPSIIDGKILSGSVIISGDPKPGNTLVARCALNGDGKYGIKWYNGSYLIGEGAQYTVKSGDIGLELSAVAEGLGDYSGSRLTDSVMIREPDVIAAPETDTDEVVLIVTVLSMFFFVCGMLCYRIRISVERKKKQESQTAQPEEELSEENGSE